MPRMPQPLHENLVHQLKDSIDRLQEQVAKVEFWADAIAGFAKPVPDYEPEAATLARYVRPQPQPQPKKRRHRSAGGGKRVKPASA